MSFALAEMERLLANLIRVGTVTALDSANARVKVAVGGLATDWLPWITARAGATRTWSAPRAGEQVLVLSPYGDPAQAVVVPSIYQDDHPAPANSQDIERVEFPDGAVVEYDSAAKVMTVTTSGNVIVNCSQAVINAESSVTLNTPQTTCTGNLTVEGLLTYLGGMVGSGGSGASAQITGNVAFSGGTLTHNSTDIGSTHKHGGVQTGGGQTGTPV